jgi:MFS family permease
LTRHPTREVLGIAAVRWFIVARVCRGISGTLLGATIGWHVYDLTGSALALGLLGILEFMPVIPVGLYGGALADTRDRVALARRTLLGVAACLAALAFVGFSGLAVPWVFGLAVLAAACQAMERPATAAILPALVPTEKFGAAVVVVSTVRNAAWAVGPVVAGVLIAWGGVGASYALGAGLVLTSVVVMGALPPAEPEGERGEGVSWRSALEGVAFVRGNRPVLGSMALDLFAVIFASVDALLPIFAREVLQVGPAGFGVLSGSLAAGTFLMSALLLARPPGDRPGRALLWAVAVFGAATLVFAASSAFAVSVAALVFAGMADQVSMVAREIILQLATPDSLRGRVNAVNFVFISASNELGRAESGLLASLVGAVASVWIGGGLCLGALGAVAFRMPELRGFRVSEAARATRGT